MFFVFQTRVCGGDPEADADVALATCMELSGGEWLEAEPLYAPRREAASSLVGDGGEVWLVTVGERVRRRNVGNEFRQKKEYRHNSPLGLSPQTRTDFVQ